MKEKALALLNGLVTEQTPKGEVDIIEYCKMCVRAYEAKKKAESGNENFINDLYEKFYKLYSRKGSKEQGRKTFRKKLARFKSEEEILAKARAIYRLYLRHEANWIEEEREKQYIPLVSSWLNANVKD